MTKEWFTYICPKCKSSYLLLKEPNEKLLPIESKCAGCRKNLK